MEQRRTGILACVERIYGQSVREEHNLIKVEHVKKSFKEKEVLKDITFEFLPDRVYVIIAPNGTGKTTFINTSCRRRFSRAGRTSRSISFPVCWRSRS